MFQLTEQSINFWMSKRWYSGQNRWYTCVLQSENIGKFGRPEVKVYKLTDLSEFGTGNILLPVDLSSGKSVEIGGQLLSELYDLVDYSFKKSRLRGTENENSHCELENERVKKTSTGI